MSRQKLFAVLGVVVFSVAVIGAGVALVGASTPSSPSDFTTSASDNPKETIHVGATGSAEAQPDKAVVRISIEHQSNDPSTARSKVSENVSNVKEALNELGIEDSAIRTEDFRISEARHRRPPTRDAEPETQYRARHRLSVEVADIEQTGDVIDAAIDSGSAEIHDVQFTLADDTRDELRNEALEDAMTNARGKADIVANSASLSITGVHSVSTNRIRIPRHRVGVQAMAAGDGGGSTDLNEGPVSVHASVSVTYNATQTFD